MYEFRGIDVAGSNSHVKVSDAPVSICFTDHTSFVEVMEPTVNHPTEKFRLQMYDQLMALANTNVDLAGGRGEASDPRDNSVDGSSTGEGAPVEEDWCSAEKTQNE
ncbi:hypothetical protein Bca52824_080334 [Brassica carinata]|uniref:Uncharacterized protein n=1 Tax=Brassica carinata TaxID=52824 RepID=A0A8X7PFW5_BRACI|nr:hypothetical protein Bca52824_080334 [Brassica carinata]